MVRPIEFRMQECLEVIFDNATNLGRLLHEAESELKSAGVELFDYFPKPIEEMGISEKVKAAQLIIRLRNHFKKN